MMKYCIKSTNCTSEPFWLDKVIGSKPNIEYTNMFQYANLDFEQAVSVLNEVLDSPTEYITPEIAQKDFGPNLTDESVKQIMNYYNWRKDRYDEFLASLKLLENDVTKENYLRMYIPHFESKTSVSSDVIVFTAVILIPYENNHFVCKQTTSSEEYNKIEDERERNTKQLDASIVITATLTK